MSTITTTRSYNIGDTFSFTVAAKNGYGIKVEDVASMQDYLEPGTESIEEVGNEYSGSENGGYYPGVRISGQLMDTSVNYNILSNVRNLLYYVKFSGGYNPLPPHDSIPISNPPDDDDLPTQPWSPEPLVLITPTIDTTDPDAPDPSTLQFVSWHCFNDDRDYVAGSRIYVNDDLNFEAIWQPAPVTVAVETDSDENDSPEFENE